MTDLELQLLPERRKRIDVSTPGQNRPVFFAVLAILVVVLLYVGLYFYKSSLVSSAHSVDNDLATLEQKRDKTTEDKLLLLDKKLAAASPLLNDHLLWSNAFTKIQNLTEPQVQFKTLSASVSEKKITIKAEAANYNVLAHQIAALLTEKAITNIALDKVTSLPTGRIEFTLSLSYEPKTFLAKVAK